MIVFNDIEVNVGLLIVCFGRNGIWINLLWIVGYLVLIKCSKWYIILLYIKVFVV